MISAPLTASHQALNGCSRCAGNECQSASEGKPYGDADSFISSSSYSLFPSLEGVLGHTLQPRVFVCVHMRACVGHLHISGRH